MSRPPRSTPAPSSRCSSASRSFRRVAPPCSSRIASRAFAWPTASWSWARERWKMSARTRSCSREAADTRSCSSCKPPDSASPASRSFEESLMIDTIVDLSHNNTVDLAKLRQGGISAIIHKASEGASFHDVEYAARRTRARELGFLWGAYHYSSGASVSEQVANFLEHARPDDRDLVALDWEASTDGPD